MDGLISLAEMAATSGFKIDNLRSMSVRDTEFPPLVCRKRAPDRMGRPEKLYDRRQAARWLANKNPPKKLRPGLDLSAAREFLMRGCRHG